MTIVQSVMLSVVNLSVNEAFQNQHKKTPKAFTRKRKLTFPAVVGMLLRMVKQSIQITCNWFGDLIGDDAPSKQAFSIARQKISPECFQAFHADGIRVNYTMAPKKGLWKGYRIIACDGSTLRLPDSEELGDFFGRWSGQEGHKPSAPMARISEFTDMATKLVLSGRIAPCNVSEEALAMEQLVEVIQIMRGFGQEKLLFVYDRGYPSEEFIDLHRFLGVDFLFRVPKNFNKAIAEIYERGESENFLLREGWPLLRVSQFTLSSEEDELLLTTLSDDTLFTQNELSEIYHGRWTSMEEGYKRQKITMQLENFSGRTVLAIEQEYWATLTVANIIEMGCTELEGYWIPGKLPRKQVNRSVVFGSTRDSIMMVFAGKMTLADYQNRFNRIAKRSMIKVRPDRSFSRDGLRKPKNYHVYRRAC
jgi:hypothetical protein